MRRDSLLSHPGSCPADGVHLSFHFPFYPRSDADPGPAFQNSQHLMRLEAASPAPTGGFA